MENDEREPGDKRPGTNPFGRPPLAPEIVEIRRLNQREAIKLINKVVWLTKEELEALWFAKETPVIELMLAKVAIEVMKTGDSQKLNALLDRLIGKVKERPKDEQPKPTVMKLVGEDAALVLGPPPKRDDDE